MAAIILFIIIGTVLLIGYPGRPGIGLSNYFGRGGFAPNGFAGLVRAMAMVMVAYGGTEVIGVAAGETKDPAKSVPAAVRGIAARTPRKPVRPGLRRFGNTQGIGRDEPGSPHGGSVQPELRAGYQFPDGLLSVILIWLIIALSHVRWRAKVTADSAFKAPLYPYLSISAAVLLAAFLGTLWAMPEQRVGIFSPKRPALW